MIYSMGGWLMASWSKQLTEMEAEGINVEFLGSGMEQGDEVVAGGAACIDDQGGPHHHST